MPNLVSKHPLTTVLALVLAGASIIAFPLSSFAFIMLGWTMARTPKANIFEGRLALAHAGSVSEAAFEGLCAAVAAVFGFNAFVAVILSVG